MPLSTSSSKVILGQPAALRKGSITILLAIIALLLAGFEVFTRVVIERASNVQREVNQQYREAISIRRRTGPAGTKQLLIVGNSLVGHDLDFHAIQKAVQPEWQAHEFWIYATAYEDWYYGLRRLFAEGATPDVVAITFAAMHWETSGIRGDYGSLYMFRPQDIPRIGAEADLDRTKTSNLLFARFSKFYALRSEVRKQAFQALIPDLPALYSLFKPTASHHRPAYEVASIIEPRLERMAELVRQHGAKLILIVPPVPRPGEEYHAELLNAARKAGIQRVVMPMRYADLPPGDFSDDVHLSPYGAKVFTDQLIGPLRNALGETAAVGTAARTSLK